MDESPNHGDMTDISPAAADAAAAVAAEAAEEDVEDTSAASSEHSRDHTHQESGEETTDDDALVECWICRDSENTADHRIISGICRCVGSTRCVHLKCISQWLRTTGNQACPSCNTPYQWQYRCSKEVPYPNGTWAQIRFVVRHFLVPLVFRKLALLLLLYTVEYFVLPVLVGCVFYGSLTDARWPWQHSAFHTLELWLLGGIFLTFTKGILDAWEAWLRFFAGHHRGRTPRVTPLPIDELDIVYYDATAAAQRRKNASRAGGGETGGADPPVLYQDRDILDPRNEGLDNQEEEGHRADDEEHWEDVDTSPGDEDNGEESTGSDETEGTSGLADDNIGLDGSVAPLFRVLDEAIEDKADKQQLAGLYLRRLPLAMLAALLLRSTVGVVAVAVGLYAAAVVVRFRHPRRVMRNPRRRLDEMVANTLCSAKQVTPAEKQIWFATLLSQLFLFSFVMPTVGGIVVRYATAPFLCSFPSSLTAFVDSLNIVWITVYWCIGTVAALLLMTIEANLMVPLFAPGVDLFFVRAIDLHFDLERLYYELILAQIYDTDPLGVLFDFMVLAPIEVLAALFFVAFPLWGAFGLREFVFSDLSTGRIALPLRALSFPAARESSNRNDTPLSAAATHRDWLQANVVAHLAERMPNTTDHICFQTYPAEVDTNESVTPIIDGEAAASLVPVAAPSPWAYAASLLATTALLNDEQELFAHLTRAAADVERSQRRAAMQTGLLASTPASSGPSWRRRLLPVAPPSWETTKILVGLLPQTAMLVGRSGGVCDLALITAAHGARVMRTVADEAGVITTELMGRPSAHFAREPWTWVSQRQQTMSTDALASVLKHYDAAHNDSHRSLSYCASSLLSIPMAQFPVLRPLAEPALHFFVSHPYVLAIDFDSSAIVFVLAAIVCICRAPMQRTQLAVLRPICHFLARRVVDLEWFLFDPARDEMLAAQLATGNLHAPIDMPMLPPQHLILRRHRNFRPEELPANLPWRLAAFSALFLLIGCLCIWCVPILVLFLSLGGGSLTVPFAIGWPILASFGLWHPPTAILAVGMTILIPVSAIIFVAYDVYFLLSGFSLAVLADDTWKYVSGAERVLVPYTEAAGEN